MVTMTDDWLPLRSHHAAGKQVQYRDLSDIGYGHFPPPRINRTILQCFVTKSEIICIVSLKPQGLVVVDVFTVLTVLQ